MLVAEFVGILGWAGISPQTLLAASSNPNMRAIFIALFLGSVGAALGGFRRRDGYLDHAGRSRATGPGSGVDRGPAAVAPRIL